MTTTKTKTPTKPTAKAKAPSKAKTSKAKTNAELIAGGKKRCASCSKIKALDAFGTSARDLGGVNPYCKECVKAKANDRNSFLRQLKAVGIDKPEALEIGRALKAGFEGPPVKEL